jgi:hypothetical protein
MGNEVFHNLYSWENVFILMESRRVWNGLIEEECLQNLSRKTQRNKPHGRTRFWWEVATKINPQGVGSDIVGWIGLTQDNDKGRLLLWGRWWTFGFHKMRAIYCPVRYSLLRRIPFLHGDSNLRDESRKQLDAIFEAVLLAESPYRF